MRRDIAADIVRAAGISGAAELFLRLMLTEGWRRLYLRVWRVVWFLAMGCDMTWIVLWKNNMRIGSVEFTPENSAAIREQFVVTLIQRDASGTIHWEVLAAK